MYPTDSDIRRHSTSLCVCLYSYLNSKEKSKVCIRLVFSLIPRPFPLSTPNCLTFKKVSVVTPPAKISVWNVEVYWSLCLLSSTLLACRPLRSPPILSCASWEQELNRWLYLRHWLSYHNREDCPSPLFLPAMRSSERQQSRHMGLQPQNLMKERAEQPLPLPLSVPFSSPA